VAQLKWYQLTLLHVTFECLDVIRWFLPSATTVTHTRCEPLLFKAAKKIVFSPLLHFLFTYSHVEHYRIHAASKCHVHRTWHAATQQTGLKSGNPVDYAFWGARQERVYHGRKFENVEQKQAIVLEWCAISQPFTDYSIDQWVGRRLQCHIREWWTYWTQI